MSVKETYQKFIQDISYIYDEAEANSIARIVFEDVFQIYTFDSQVTFTSGQLTQLEKIKDRLLINEPVQYILGQADFYGLKFKVNPSVLIPRQETEELVHWIWKDCQKIGKTNPSILDIGTGSACIPITLKYKLKEASVTAMDISPDALVLAAANASLNGVNINLIENDILDESTWTTFPNFDIIVSNPPYIPHNEAALMPERVKQFEPHLALFVENNNALIFYQKIAEFAKQHLTNNGVLYFETNEHNAQEVVQMLVDNGFNNTTLKKDIDGKERMIRAEFTRQIS